MSNDPICSTCGEPKSVHVKTERGPYTHPREARGEGEYVWVGGGYTSGGGLTGDDMYFPPRYVFKPNPPVSEIDDPAEAEASG